MSKKLIIFGKGKISEVIVYYAKERCGLDVAAFTVDKSFNDGSSFMGLPVVDFEEVQSKYPPSEFDMFVAVGYHNMNRLRQARCEQAIAKGYKLQSIISPAASLPSNVEVGWNCFVMDPALVHPCVSIGNNVFVWNGALIGHHSKVSDHCWLTSGCNVSGNVTLGKNCFLAVNSTVGHSVTIGSECFLGANSLVTKSIADKSVMIHESTKPLRLNSDQFLRMSGFSEM